MDRRRLSLCLAFGLILATLAVAAPPPKPPAVLPLVPDPGPQARAELARIGVYLDPVAGRKRLAIRYPADWIAVISPNVVWDAYYPGGKDTGGPAAPESVYLVGPDRVLKCSIGVGAVFVSIGRHVP